MLTYYIPGTVGGREVYLRLHGPDAEIIPADQVEVDPFSRVTAPPLKEGWADDLHMSEQERVAFEEAPVAYTRATLRVSEAARRRMVQAVQDSLARHLWQGTLWFRLDGTGGAWYPDETRVPDPKRTIVVPLRPHLEAEDLVDDAVAAWEERYGHA